MPHHQQAPIELFAPPTTLSDEDIRTSVALMETIAHVFETGRIRPEKLRDFASLAFHRVGTQPSVMPIHSKICHRMLQAAAVIAGDSAVVVKHVEAVIDHAGPSLFISSDSEHSSAVKLARETLGILSARNSLGPLIEKDEAVIQWCASAGASLAEAVKQELNNYPWTPPLVAHAIWTSCEAVNKLSGPLHKLTPRSAEESSPLLMGPATNHITHLTAAVLFRLWNDHLIPVVPPACMDEGLRLLKHWITQPLQLERLGPVDLSTLLGGVRYRLHIITRESNWAIEAVATARPAQHLPRAKELAHELLDTPSIKTLSSGTALPSAPLRIIDCREGQVKLAWGFHSLSGAVVASIPLPEGNNRTPFRGDIFSFGTGPYGALPPCLHHEAGLRFFESEYVADGEYFRICDKLTRLGLGLLEDLWKEIPEVCERVPGSSSLALYLVPSGIVALPADEETQRTLLNTGRWTSNDGEVSSLLEHIPRSFIYTTARYALIARKNWSEFVVTDDQAALQPPVVTEKLERKLLRECLAATGAITYDKLESILKSLGVIHLASDGKGSHGRLERRDGDRTLWVGTWYRIRENTEPLPLWFIHECLDKLEISATVFCRELQKR